MTGDKTEHSDIELVSKESLKELLSKTPERASDLTLTAIDLYLKEA